MNGVLASYGGSLAAGGADKEVAKAKAASAGAGKGKGKDNIQGGEIPKMNAHPIVGWKGFEDVINIIPGATVDIAQKGDGTSAKGPSCKCPDRFFRLAFVCSFVPLTLDIYPKSRFHLS
jgi:hypothetical protein